MYRLRGFAFFLAVLGCAFLAGGAPSGVLAASVDASAQLNASLSIVAQYPVLIVDPIEPYYLAGYENYTSVNGVHNDSGFHETIVSPYTASGSVGSTGSSYAEAAAASASGSLNASTEISHVGADDWYGDGEANAWFTYHFTVTSDAAVDFSLSYAAQLAAGTADDVPVYAGYIISLEVIDGDNVLFSNQVERQIGDGSFYTGSLPESGAITTSLGLVAGKTYAVNVWGRASDSGGVMPNAVPIPPAMILFGSGLAGLAALKPARKAKK